MLYDNNTLLEYVTGAYSHTNFYDGQLYSHMSFDRGLRLFAFCATCL